MTDDRSKIHIYPLHSTVYSQAIGSKPMGQWIPKADILLDGTGGVVVEHRITRLYALWTGRGSIRTLPQRQVAEALAASSEMVPC
jgi:hypothetical protein